LKQFNAKTAPMGDVSVPAEVTVFEDRSFSFVTKTPPASILIRKAIGLEKGSANPLKNKVGKISRKQIREIAEQKMPDLNANDLDAAEKIVAGSARSMGVEVTD
jgi:large subunit ribosomal protein L11